jgi:hypothetical protein
MRAHGKLKKALWADEDWRKLPADAMWLYAYLVSQPTTDTAGVFPTHHTKWAKAAADMTVERATDAAKALNAAGFIAVDHDTEEGVLTTYIADDEAGTNIFVGALKRCRLVQSPTLRRALLDEVLSLDRQFSDHEQHLVDELANSLPPWREEVSPGRTASAPSSSSASTQASQRRLDTVPTPSQRRRNPVDQGEGNLRACTRCNDAQALGPDATPAENPAWCGSCNFEVADAQRWGTDPP